MSKSINIASGQFLRFVVIGVVSTILNYAVFYAFLRGVGVYYVLASAIGFCCGATLGFYFNRAWTFKSDKSNVATLPRYMVLYSVSLAVGLAVLWIGVEFLGMSAELAKFMTIGVSTVINFLGAKFWVFKT